MKTFVNITCVILASLCLSSCSSFVKYMLDQGKSDEAWYDDMKCKHGFPAEPGVVPRQGCINAQTWMENMEELREYRLQRKLYIQERSGIN